MPRWISRRSPSTWAAVLLLLLLAPAGLGAATLAPVAGRSFGAEDKLKLKLVGIGGVKGPAVALVAFGPSGELAADEVQIVVDDGETALGVSGTFSVDGNGRPQIQLDPAELADLLESLFLELGELDEGLTLEIVIKKVETKVRVKAKEAGDKFKLRLFLRFNVKVSGDGGSAKLKAKLLFEGKGGELSAD